MSFNSIISETRISTDSFLIKVGEYSTFEDALVNLPDEYLEFYLKNEKKLKRPLSRIINMDENWSAEGPGDVAQSKDSTKKVKTIKYRGQLFHLVWDPEIGSWSVIPGFRSITQALRYGKELVDSY